MCFSFSSSLRIFLPRCVLFSKKGQGIEDRPDGAKRGVGGGVSFVIMPGAVMSGWMIRIVAYGRERKLAARPGLSLQLRLILILANYFEYTTPQILSPGQ